MTWYVNDERANKNLIYWEKYEKTPQIDLKLHE